mgnify:CR=1 FL=1
MNSMKTSKSTDKKSTDNVSMKLPRRVIKTYGKQNKKVIRSYVKVKDDEELLLISISMGINLGRVKKNKLARAYKFWGDDINKEIEQQQEIQKAIKIVKKKKKSVVVEGIVSSKFNNLTLYKYNKKTKTKYAYKVGFNLMDKKYEDSEIVFEDGKWSEKKTKILITSANYFKIASKRYDDAIIQMYNIAYDLPTGEHIILQPVLEGEKKSKIIKKSKDFNFKDYITFTPIPKKLKKSKIKLAGSMELDGFIKNEIWDTQTDRCVPDWIIYKYQDVKGFKKVCNYENIQKISLMGLDEEDEDEREPNKNGYTKDHIRNFCKNVGINLYILNNGKLEIYDRQENIKRNLPLVIEIKNNHLYPITDKHIISKLSSVVGGNLKEIKTDKFQEISKEKENLTEKIFNTEKVECWEWLINTMVNNKTMIYTADNINIINGQLQKFNLKGKNYICDYNEDLHKYFGDEYEGQNEISILNKYIKDTPKSYLNNDIKDALFRENVKNRTHYGICCEDNNINPDDDSVIKYDINKHYKSVMTNPFDDWIMFDFNSTVEVCYDFDNEFGLYYVETDDLTLLHKSNWYSNTILQYANDNGVDFVCKYFIKGKRHNKNMLKDVIDEIEKDVKDPCVKKLIINAISGYMGKTHTKNISAILDTDDNSVFENFFKLRNVEHKQMYFKKYQLPTTEEGDDLNINVCGETSVKEIVNNNLPVYIQILDFANMVLHKHIKNIGGTLVARKTDAFWVHEPEYEPELNDTIGGLKLENKSYVGDMKRERDCIYRMKDNSFNNIEINDSNDYERIIDIVKEKSIMLLGRAGVGKTFVLKKIQEVYGNKCISLAFTNKATNNLGGQTIHNCIGLDASGKINAKYYHSKLNNAEVIIVDEISMLNVDLWKIFEMIKHTKPNIRFVLSGDYRQLPPIEVDGLYDYFNHPVIKYICDFNRVELTKVKRYDNELYELSEKVWNNTINEEDIKNMTKNDKNLIYNADTNIVWTNKKRKQLNKMCNEYHSKNADEFLMVEYKGDENKYNENIIIYKGVKLLCNISCKKLDIRKNETLIVDKFDDKNIYIGDKVIPVDKIHKTFILGYAMTTYKSQGDTYKGLINIFEYDIIMQDKRFLYTAITRATKYNNVNFMTI